MRNIGALRTGWAPARWSTSGNEIFAFEPGADHATATVSRINIDNRVQTPWFTLRPADNVGAYLLKWVDVTPDGRSYAYTYQQDLSDLYILDGVILNTEDPRPPAFAVPTLQACQKGGV